MALLPFLNKNEPILPSKTTKTNYGEGQGTHKQIEQWVNSKKSKEKSTIIVLM